MDSYPALDHNGPTPVYLQITRWMRDNILSARWRPDHKLDAESDLAEHLGVSRGTVRRAIETLIDEGLLTRIHGRGTFVRSNLILEQQPTGAIAGFSRDLLSRGIPFSTEVPFCQVTHPNPTISSLLHITTDDHILHMRRIRRIQDHANILIENHVVYHHCQGVENVDFSQNQLYKTLEDDFGIPFLWARRTYRACIASEEIAEILEIRVGGPVMYLEELYHIENDIPVEFTRAWFNGDLFHITTRIDRADEKRQQPGFYR